MLQSLAEWFWCPPSSWLPGVQYGYSVGYFHGCRTCAIVAAVFALLLFVLRGGKQ